jgi:prolyl-tRNA synthetase
MKKNDLFNNKQKENSNMKQRKITKRTDDYSKWYLDVIREASLLDDSPVKGCMVMRPYGCGKKFKRF